MSEVADKFEERSRQRRALSALLDDHGGNEKALNDTLWAIHASFEEARLERLVAKPLPLAEKMLELRQDGGRTEPGEPNMFAPIKRLPPVVNVKMAAPYFPDAKLIRKAT